MQDMLRERKIHEKEVARLRSSKRWTDVRLIRRAADRGKPCYYRAVHWVRSCQVGIRTFHSSLFYFVFHFINILVNGDPFNLFSFGNLAISFLL